LTQQLAQAAKVMDIELVDHLIVACGRFVSLKEKGFFD
jgi:DNA repair protein RadC